MTDPKPETVRPIGQKRRGKRSAVFTSTPEVSAPALTCPTCDTSLEYKQTVISGVKPIERWDYFECRTCGPYVYRERTRALRLAR
jgi:hypothetical protein